MSDLLFAATLATALGCGLIAGTFFAFSAFVMPGLRQLPAGEAVAATQAINRTAVMPAFLSVFLGTAAASLALVVVAALDRDQDHAPWLAAGGVLYVAGTLLVTIGFHVPRNDALATVDAAAPDAEEHWRRYDREWTTMNHLRGLAALAASAALIVALTVGQA